MAYGRAINCIFQGLAYDDVICLDRGLGKSPLPTGIGKHTPPFSFGRTELRSSHTINKIIHTTVSALQINQESEAWLRQAGGQPLKGKDSSRKENRRFAFRERK